MAELKEEDVIVGAITRVLVLRPAQLPDGFKGQAEALYRVMQKYMVPWGEHKLALARIEDLESQLIKQSPEGQETALEQLLLDLEERLGPPDPVMVEEAREVFKGRYPPFAVKIPIAEEK